MNLTFLTEEEKRLLDNQYKQIIFIGFSIIASIPIYFLIGSLVEFDQKETSKNTIRYIFLFIALLIAFLIRIIRSIILKKQNKTSLINLLSRLKASSIITLTLCEAIAILGITEYFITNIKMDLYLMLLLSIVFLAVHFPRKYLWIQYINLHIREFREPNIN